MSLSRSRPPGMRFSSPRLAWVKVLVGLFGLLLPLSTPASPAPRRQGEAFTWTMRIAGFIDAGRARLAIAPAQKVGAGSQLQAVGEAEATGLAKAITGMHDDYRLLLDGATLLPRKITIEETGYRIRNVQILLDGRRTEIVDRRPGKEQRLVANPPSEALEPVSVLLLLRVARLGLGDQLDLIILDGTNFYQGSIEVVGREPLTTELGTYQAIRLLCRGERIDPSGRKFGRPPRQATLWLSDDPLRLPLRVEAQTDFGTGEFVLTSYEAARRPLILPTKLLGITERQRLEPAK